MMYVKHLETGCKFTFIYTIYYVVNYKYVFFFF